MEAIATVIRRTLTRTKASNFSSLTKVRSSWGELLLGLAAAGQQRVRTAVAMGLPTAGLVSL